MVMSVIKEYNAKIPEPVRRILDVLSEENRRGLMVILVEQRERSFKELMTITGFSTGTLTYHLKELMGAGLVENIYRKSEDKDVYSIYRPTELGNDFMMTLILGEGLELPKAKRS